MKISLAEYSPDLKASDDGISAGTVRIKETINKVILFIILLACSLAVFLLAPNYYALFPTNGSLTYVACLAAVFLAGALMLRHTKRYTQFWPIAYAFFIASAAILSSDLFIGYSRNFIALFGAADVNQSMALQKLYDTLLVVIPILLLTLVSGASLGSLYLRVGNQHSRWGIGIGALVLFNFFTSVLLFFGAGYAVSRLGSVVIWGLVFAFSNSLLEELWIRGLFIGKMLPLLGAVGTVLLTSLAFAAMHFLGVAYLPSAIIPVYVINTFTLGVACSLLMIKTGSIWGAYLVHAAADVFLFIAILAVR